jgi:hypothetical protein
MTQLSEAGFPALYSTLANQHKCVLVGTNSARMTVWQATAPAAPPAGGARRYAGIVADP